MTLGLGSQHPLAQARDMEPETQDPGLCPWLILGCTPRSLQGRDLGPSTLGTATTPLALPVGTRAGTSSLPHS